jgi:hypothetical protein
MRNDTDRIVPLRERDFVTDNDVVEARNKIHAAQAGVATAASELRKAQDALGIVGDVNSFLSIRVTSSLVIQVTFGTFDVSQMTIGRNSVYEFAAWLRN